jgi:hypothetical protein
MNAPMLNVAEFRRYAEECRRLAKLATLVHIQEQLLMMAASWDSLAEDRERQLKNPRLRARGETHEIDSPPRAAPSS